MAALAGATIVSAGSVMHARHPHPQPGQATDLVARSDPLLAVNLALGQEKLWNGPLSADLGVGLYLAVEELDVNAAVAVLVGEDFVSKPVLEISLAKLEVKTVVDLYASAKLDTFIELKVLDAIDVAVSDVPGT